MRAAAFARCVWLLALGGWLAGVPPTGAEPAIVSTLPPTGATDVSPSAPVIFTFSAPMDQEQTLVQFVDGGAYPAKFLSATPAWSADGRQLTNTPAPAFPANTVISWIASGQDANGLSLTGKISGVFMTSSGGGVAPTIVSVSPANEATNVGANTPVIFEFSAAMKPDATAVQFTAASAPLVPLPVSTAWSADGFWLTNTPAPAFPPDAIIIWSATGQDRAGTALQEMSGAFWTAASGGGPTNTESGVVLFSRGVTENQTDTNLFESAGLEFLALADTASGVEVEVVPPPQQATNVLSVSGPPDALEFADSQTDPLAFATNYPAGDYQCVVGASTGISRAVMTLQDDPVAPVARFLGWHNPPHIVLGQPPALQWTLDGDGAPVDYLRLRIEQDGNVVFATPLPGAAGALTGASNNIVVPAGVFTNAGLAEVSLTAFSFTSADTNSISGLALRAARHHTTTFELRVVDGSAPPPVLLTTNMGGVAVGEQFWNPLFTTNGVRPLRFELIGGQLPPGLALEPEGAIEGEPAAAGTFDSTVRLTDLLGQSSTQSLRVVTVPLPPGSLPPRLENVSVAGGFVAFDVLDAAGADCTVERSTDLSHWTACVTTNAATNRLTLHLPRVPGGEFFRARVVSSSPPLPAPHPLKVALALNSNVNASAELDEFGGELSLTNGGGYVFTLNVPPGALARRETITMTDVAQISGLPLSGGLRAAVDLQPEGLLFETPARLDITAPGTLDPKTLLGFGAQSDGNQFALRPSFVTNHTVSLYLWHFTMSGIGNGTTTDSGAQAQNRPPNDPMSTLQQQAAAQLQACAADPGCDPSSLSDSLVKIFIQMADQVIIPQLQQAVNNEALVDDAIRNWLAWLRQQQLLPIRDDTVFGGDQATQLNNRVRRAGSLAAQAIRNAIQTNCQRCLEHDVWRIYRMLELTRVAALLGLGYEQMAWDCIQKCLVFELTIESEIVSSDGGVIISAHTKGKAKLHPVPNDDPSIAMLTWRLQGSGQWEITELQHTPPSGCAIAAAPAAGRFDVPMVTMDLYKKRQVWIPGDNAPRTVYVFDPQMTVRMRSGLPPMPKEHRQVICPLAPPAPMADIFGQMFNAFHNDELEMPQGLVLDALGGPVFRITGFVQGSGPADVILTKVYPLRTLDVTTENTLIELRHTPQ